MSSKTASNISWGFERRLVIGSRRAVSKSLSTLRKDDKNLSASPLWETRKAEYFSRTLFLTNIYLSKTSARNCGESGSQIGTLVTKVSFLFFDALTFSSWSVWPASTYTTASKTPRRCFFEIVPPACGGLQFARARQGLVDMVFQTPEARAQKNNRASLHSSEQSHNTSPTWPNSSIIRCRPMIWLGKEITDNFDRERQFLIT